jgi:C-terminal processing protease CtpA/Prc
VVVLIDESAISQAEYTCQFLESAANATFIGSPTNGTDGDVTDVGLPGSITVSFTGQGVCHGDGRQAQRIGILPDVKAAPTRAGLRAGRDEVLEAAIRFLKEKTGA